MLKRFFHGLLDAQILRSLLLVFLLFAFSPSFAPTKPGYAARLIQSDCVMLSEGQAQAGDIGPSGDEDCYLVQAQIGDQLTVFADNNTTSGTR